MLLIDFIIYIYIYIQSQINSIHDSVAERTRKNEIL